MPAPEADALMLGGVRITHPDRVLFAGEGTAKGMTKGDLARYHAALAPLMLPHAADRPMSLVRCPDGVEGDCFYQKHAGGAFGPHVHGIPIVDKDGRSDDYLYIDDADGLLACVQMGAIEFHGWGAHVADVERPDRMVFDLDPDEGLGFAAVRAAAREVRSRLAAEGLESFAMLTGGKGIHVVVPLAPGHDWAAHRDFARALALRMSEDAPARFVATMSREKRKGRIFIDWLRNQRGNTAIMPYSVRARAGAPVAAPVSWDELDGMESARRFGIGDTAALLARASSPALADWGRAAQRLPVP